MQRAWHANYPAGVPHELPPLPYETLGALFEDAFRRYGAREACRYLGHRLTFAAIERAAADFSAYLQSLGLKKGDRLALMMPNVPQYPVAVAAAMRLGLVIVNVNPLYTPRELEHQLKDAGAVAIVVLDVVAGTLAACIAATQLRHVVVARLGDMLPWPKGRIVDFVARRVKKLVPPYRLPGAVAWREALRRGAKGSVAPVPVAGEDLAVLQYTGGTTGIAKGAMLTHRNIVANVLQSELWYAPALARVPPDEQPVIVGALPLYHIFGFTVNMLLAARTGSASLLIVNPRDIPALLAALGRMRFHSFPAVNTLFDVIARHKGAKHVDWSGLKLAVGGGMAVNAATSKRWQALTGLAICEGYGLSETSPVLCCNSVLATGWTGTIGYPLPSTELRIVDEAGEEVAPGERGELVAKGPQVMRGYWRRPAETAEAFTADGWFRTGDIGVMNPDGSFSIVDRRKDMIIVSGFNVYPSEVEAVVTAMPGIAEAAVIGVADGASGEAVKLFVVRGDGAPTEDAIRDFCREKLTPYKRPKLIEFRDELPKSNVGKVLRRLLREDAH
ncbi:long-chain-fatty-acid--CoA ligase [Aureimonas endophytica]|uniref:Long-chain-fatty-acid--CoA ligase n=1 Tax=Aureimonas endophytica TaxID=2027858 RepID=A0A917E267_9HYPH|nr:AMP-binding protein [Aureimonas endophytica]GGD95395.1 long-chain-fatty-acid--CoA ligase [Aureimonas endophytica]